MSTRSIIALFLVTIFITLSYDAGAQRRRHRRHSTKKTTITKDSTSNDEEDASLNAKTILTIYPTSFFISTLKAGIEFKTGDKSTLKLIPSFASAENSNWFGNTNSNNGMNTTAVKNMTEFSLQIQPRFYVTNISRALDGFYMAPFLMYRQMSFRAELQDNSIFPSTTSTKDGSASAITIGYTLGYQKILPSGFTLDFFAGGGVNIPSGDNSLFESPLNEYRRGIVPQIGFSLGFAL